MISGTPDSELGLAAYLARTGLKPVPGSEPFLPTHAEPERDLLARIRQLATQHGWLCYHTHDSRRSEAGFPDLVLVKPGRLIFAEVKTATGKLTQAQETWLDLLAHSIPGVEVYCWRPKDYPHIVQVLTAKTRVPDITR